MALALESMDEDDRRVRDVIAERRTAPEQDDFLSTLLRIEAQNEQITKRVAELQRFVERFGAKNTKATQAQSKLKQIERMDKIAAPSGQEATREVSATYTKEGTKLTMQWKGAGTTTGRCEGAALS